MSGTFRGGDTSNPLATHMGDTKKLTVHRSLSPSSARVGMVRARVLALTTPFLIVRGDRVKLYQVLLSNDISDFEEQIPLVGGVETALKRESELLYVFVHEVLLEAVNEKLLVTGVQHFIHVPIEVADKVDILRIVFLTTHANNIEMWLVNVVNMY